MFPFSHSPSSDAGQLEFWNTGDMTMMNNADHTMATDLEWDPTGRYVVTSISFWQQKVGRKPVIISRVQLREIPLYKCNGCIVCIYVRIYIIYMYLRTCTLICHVPLLPTRWTLGSACGRFRAGLSIATQWPWTSSARSYGDLGPPVSSVRTTSRCSGLQWPAASVVITLCSLPLSRTSG